MVQPKITLDREHTSTVGLIADDRKLIFRTRQVALKLGVNLHVLPSLGGSDNLGDLIASASRCDVVTFESSALPAAHRDILRSAGIRLRPGPQAAELADDPTSARRVLENCGFDVVPIGMDVAPVGLSRKAAGLCHGPRSVGELRVVLARRPCGLRTVYPVAELCGRRPSALAAVAVTSPCIAESAISTAVSIADGIDATGIISVSFGVGVDKRPRVSGIALGPHVTNEPSQTSQIENHLRAILDWPLTATMIEPPLWRAARRRR